LPVDFAKVLQENHSDLRKYLSLQELIPLLRKSELLTAEEWDEISLRQQTQQQKVDYFVQLLPRKGGHAYEKFLTCLELEKEHSGHVELAEKIKETAAKLTVQLMSTNACEEVTCHAVYSTKGFMAYVPVVIGCCSSGMVGHHC